MQWAESVTHRRRRLPVFTERLTNPHLRDPLDVDRRLAAVQRLGVEFAVHETGKEDESVALLRFHFEIDTPAGVRELGGSE